MNEETQIFSLSEPNKLIVFGPKTLIVKGDVTENLQVYAGEHKAFEQEVLKTLNDDLPQRLEQLVRQLRIQQAINYEQIENLIKILCAIEEYGDKLGADVNNALVAEGYLLCGSYFHNSLGSHQAALRYYDRALTRFQQGKISRLYAKGLHQVGMLYQSMDKVDTALTYYSSSTRAAEAIQAVDLVIASTFDSGLTLVGGERNKLALDLIDRSERLAQETSDMSRRFTAYLGRAIERLSALQPDEALEQLEMAKNVWDYFEMQASLLWIASWHKYRAVAFLLANDMSNSENELKKAIITAKKGNLAPSVRDIDSILQNMDQLELVLNLADIPKMTYSS